MEEVARAAEAAKRREEKERQEREAAEKARMEADKARAEAREQWLAEQRQARQPHSRSSQHPSSPLLLYTLPSPSLQLPQPCLLPHASSPTPFLLPMHLPTRLSSLFLPQVVPPPLLR